MERGRGQERHKRQPCSWPCEWSLRHWRHVPIAHARGWCSGQEAGPKAGRLPGDGAAESWAAPTSNTALCCEGHAAIAGAPGCVSRASLPSLQDTTAAALQEAARPMLLKPSPSAGCSPDRCCVFILALTPLPGSLRMLLPFPRGLRPAGARCHLVFLWLMWQHPWCKGAEVERAMNVESRRAQKLTCAQVRPQAPDWLDWVAQHQAATCAA